MALVMEQRDHETWMLRVPDHQDVEVLEIVEIVEIVEPQKTQVTERQGHIMQLTLGRRSVKAVVKIHRLSSRGRRK